MQFTCGVFAYDVNPSLIRMQSFILK